MNTQVCIEEQVRNYLQTLAPEPRRAMWRAIKNLPAGDTKRLEGKLAGWSRLRVTEHRVLFREIAEGGVRKINCIFAEKRSVVYELFAELLANELAE